MKRAVFSESDLRSLSNTAWRIVSVIGGGTGGLRRVGTLKSKSTKSCLPKILSAKKTRIFGPKTLFVDLCDLFSALLDPFLALSDRFLTIFYAQTPFLAPVNQIGGHP